MREEGATEGGSRGMKKDHKDMSIEPAIDTIDMWYLRYDACSRGSTMKMSLKGVKLLLIDESTKRPRR